MTAAKFLTSPAQGHGLTDKIVDPIYRAMSRLEPTDTFVAVVVLRPKSFGGRDTADGRHQEVSFEVSRCEPVPDKNQANELRFLVQALYEQRTSTGKQGTLALGLGSEEERRQNVMERLEDHATERGKTAAQLEQEWRAHFGIGEQAEWSDQGSVPGDYRKASLAHLLSFGYDTKALSVEDPLPSDEREKDDPDAEGATAIETGEDKCQVCGATDVPLIDGLCEKDAGNVGLRAVPDQPASNGKKPAAGKKAAASKPVADDAKAGKDAAFKD